MEEKSAGGKPRKAVSRFRYSQGGRVKNRSPSKPRLPPFTFRSRKNSAALPTRPAQAGRRFKNRSRGTISSIQLPSSVSTPKTTRLAGMTSSVTAVTRRPPQKTSNPRRRGLLPREKQKPERRMKVQQMLCCQT